MVGSPLPLVATLLTLVSWHSGSAEKTFLICDLISKYHLIEKILWVEAPHSTSPLHVYQ